jgi:transitional endoplasmic reticulum ATPase
MPIKDAIEALKRKQKDEDQIFNQMEVIEGYPLDGAVAFVKAMQRSYGWASPVPTPGFFDPQPPEMKTVKLGPKRTDVTQVPWGSFMVPGIENRIMIDSMMHEGRPALVVMGQVRKREQHVILTLVTLAREILREESIYRGKSVSLKVNGEGELTLEEPPEFMDVSTVKEQDLILNHDTMASVNMNLFNLLKHTDRCRELRVPLKRGVLLSGVYGTGKTMTARTAAAIANANGWTFINVDKVNGLAAALRFADQYSPAVLFAEDIDRVTTERDDATNDLTVIIDGVLSKTSEVITVLTTNHVEKIEQVMLRPGRLDAVINIDPPNEEAAIRLVNLYARGLLKTGEDLTDAGRVLAGNIPAVIREIVERSKLGMIGRDENVLVAEDLIVAARSMADHLALLNTPRAEPTAAERLAQSLAEVINGQALDTMDEEQLNRHFTSVKKYVDAKGSAVANTVVRASREVAGAVAHAQEHLEGVTEKSRASVATTVNNGVRKVIEAIENQ